MKLTNKDLVLEVMGRIEEIQQHITNVERAQSFAHQVRRWENPDSGNLRQSLIEAELNEWRNLFMWALTLSPAEQDRIKAAAHQRFLRKGMSVAHWFSGGTTPGQWLCADEDEFREMAKKAFLGEEKNNV
jgi:hypothetical protein